MLLVREFCFFKLEFWLIDSAASTVVQLKLNKANAALS